MEGKQVSAEEVKRAMAADVERLAEQVAEAMNAAREGRIIADTEELVRQANAVFREQLYEKAIRLLQDKQEAFSPSASRAAEQGPAADHASDRQRASVRA
jgi:methionyl-tRNA synthetase